MDQSGNGNHLGQRHKLVNASKHKVTVGKDNTEVYGMVSACAAISLPQYPPISRESR